MITRSGNNKKTLDKINKLAISLLANSISFVIGKNSVYTAIDIIKIVVYASFRSLSIEGASDELMTLCSTKICSADVIQTRLSQKSEIDLFKAFGNVQEKIYIHLRKMRLLFCKMTVAIDFTDKLYYGNKNDYGVVRTKSQKGTSSCFRYITLNIVIGDVKITLAALPVKPFSNKAKLVDWVLTETERKVKINLVLVDRGFLQKMS